MAWITRQVTIDVSPEDAWDAVRDYGALHERLARGFVTDCRMDGADRIVTFANGAVVREVPIACDDDARRLSWSIVDGPYTHHNGVAQVAEARGGGTLFTWTTDLLPDAAAEGTAAMMDQGIEAVRRTLGAGAARP